MHPTDWLLALPAFAAGAVNSIAGGGTLLTFPALLAAGVSPVTANATSTIALVPGSASSMWGYRHDLGADARRLAALAIPSVLGGAIGAVLTMVAGDRIFAILVPWLILVATILFLAQGFVAKRIQSGSTGQPGDEERKLPLKTVMIFQFVTAIYGGFFGAGMGILILAALGALGMTNLHAMNGIKNFAAVCINGVAAVTFVIAGRVEWTLAGIMAAGAIVGGYVGARLARRLGQKLVRRAIVGVGFAITAAMFVKQIRG